MTHGHACACGMSVLSQHTWFYARGNHLAAIYRPATVCWQWSAQSQVSCKDGTDVLSIVVDAHSAEDRCFTHRKVNLISICACVYPEKQHQHGGPSQS